jgi:hypothetical protein
LGDWLINQQRAKYRICLASVGRPEQTRAMYVVDHMKFNVLLIGSSILHSLPKSQV